MSIGVKVGKAFDCCQDMDGSCLREIRRSWRCLSTILSADWGQPTLSGCVDQGRVKIIFFCAGRNAGSTQQESLPEIPTLHETLLAPTT